MKAGAQVATILVTLFLFVFLYGITIFGGYMFLFLFGTMTGTGATVTIVFQFGVLFFPRSWRSGTYQFFFLVGLISSIVHTFVYLVLAWWLRTELTDAGWPDHQHRNVYFFGFNTISPWIGIHLLYLLPLVLQIIIMVRTERVKKKEQRMWNENHPVQ